MINIINTATTGLQSFSQGLSIISENVANLNTTGYKQQRITYFDLGEGQNMSGQAAGDGVETGLPFRQLSEGEIRQSDNSIDTAIRGAGFFVLKDGDSTVLTRSGQFEIGSAGLVQERGSNAVVQGLGPAGLQPISIGENRVSPPKATSRITFHGAVNNSATAAIAIPDITVFDTTGGEHIVKVTLTKTINASAGDSWDVNVMVDGVAIVPTLGPLQYVANKPRLDTQIFDNFTYTPLAGADPLTITFDFSATTLASGGAMENAVADGYGTGGITRLVFDEHGVLKAEYSNGQKADLGQLALANTFEVEKLRAIGKNQFAIDNLTDLTYGKPGRQGLGALVSSSLEASNVELTSQFSELIITQRAYQASSQVITTTNEMLAVLFELKGRR